MAEEHGLNEFDEWMDNLTPEEREMLGLNSDYWYDLPVGPYDKPSYVTNTNLTYQICHEKSYRDTPGRVGICNIESCGALAGRPECLGVDVIHNWTDILVAQSSGEFEMGDPRIYESSKEPVDVMICPSGHYCPNMDSAIPCPDGFFCDAGSSAPSACGYGMWVRSSTNDRYLYAEAMGMWIFSDDYISLMEQYENEEIYMEDWEGSVHIDEKMDKIWQWIEDEEMLVALIPKGVYCHNESRNAFHHTPWCPQGYYCPYPDTKILCPEGYFCPQGMLDYKEQKCNWFTSCPPGSWTMEAGKLFTPILLFLICLGASIIGVLHFFETRLLKHDVKHTRKRRLKGTVVTSVMDKINHGDTSAQLAGHLTFFHKSAPILHDTPEIQFQDFGFALSNRVLLQPLSGLIEAGSLIAIMGESGAGKSTFMNRLNGRAKGGQFLGKVILNGDPAQTHVHIAHLNPGFVPQFDVMHPELTVRQILTYQFYLRNQLGMNQDDGEAFIESVMILLGIDHVQHTAVGDEKVRGISGGQKKRVNIGMEIVAYPNFIFLDEPTSGLDSTTTGVIMEVLKALSNKNITILAVIHQPRWAVYKAFDKLLLLKRGGNLVYYGPTRESTAFFQAQGYELPESVNAADWYLDILAGLVPKKEVTVDDKEEVPSKRDPAIEKELRPVVKRVNTAVENLLPGLGTQSTSSISEPYEVQKIPMSMNLLQTIGSFKENLTSMGTTNLEAIETAIFKGDEYLEAETFRDRLIEQKILSTEDTEGISAVELLEAFMPSISHTENVDEDKAGGWKRVLPNPKALVKFTQKPAETEKAGQVNRWAFRKAMRQITKGDFQNAPASDFVPVPFCTQFSLCMQRSIKQVNKVQFATSLLSMLGVGVLMGMMHTVDASVQGRIPALLQAMVQSVMTCTTMIAMFSVRYYASELTVTRREISSGVNPIAFWLSKQIMIIFEQIFLNTMAFTISYQCFFFPLCSPGKILGYFILAAWFGSGLGSFLGQAMEITLATCISLVSTLVLGFLFSGLFPTLPEMLGWQKAVSDLSYARYAVESICMCEFHQLNSYMRYIIWEVVGFGTKVGYIEYPDKKNITALLLLGVGTRLLSLWWTIRIGNNRIPLFDLYEWCHHQCNKEEIEKKQQKKQQKIIAKARKSVMTVRGFAGEELIFSVFDPNNAVSSDEEESTSTLQWALFEQSEQAVSLQVLNPKRKEVPSGRSEMNRSDIDIKQKSNSLILPESNRSYGPTGF